ncbi:mixed lineage kinase domain-like protein isoform X2 [Clupea harengus]|uniref:Mixed lineage kinase domain-like protein isoform X2 n=1 Tax=Clupea harengus TaxID=7950 RepID=A0A6P8F2S9_CLUHA|nr:mixed lineage kinase domain-like protein isoform X2 [Clupea harengus]
MATIVVTVVKAIPAIIGKGLAIHKQLMQAKKNKKGCVRLADRVKTVVDQLEGLANQGVNEELLQKALDEFKKVLEEAETLLKKYEETNWWKQKFNADTWRKDFEEVNKHLCIAAHHLSLSLQVEQRKNLEDMFNDLRIRKENGEDMKIDQQEWDKLMASVEETRVVVKDVHDVVDNTNQKVSAIQHQMASAQRDLRDIKDQVGTQGAGPKSSSGSAGKARAKVFTFREKLINQIEEPTLKILLDGLQKATPDQPPVINGRERNHVLQNNRVTEDQVTCLVDMVRKKGERPCEIFLSLLSEHDNNLYKELGL